MIDDVFRKDFFKTLIISAALSLAATRLTGDKLSSPLEQTVIGLVILVYFFPVIFAMTAAGKMMLKKLRGRPALLCACVMALLVPYGIYGSLFLTGPGPGIGRYFILFALTLIWTFLMVRFQRWENWLILVLALTIWMPFESGWFVPVWSYPDKFSLYFINVIVGLNLVIFVLSGFVGYKGLDMFWEFSGRHLRLQLGTGTTLFFIAIGFSLLTGFLEVKHEPDLGMLPAHLLAMFLFVALPEEVLFRGLMQNRLHEMFTGRWTALIVTSVVFGLSHWNNAPVEDWRYVVAAGMAGIAFGYVYQKTNSVIQAAVLHALVNTVQELFFIKSSG